MFSRWIVTNITFARGTVHCRKTRIPCGDQLMICDQSVVFIIFLFPVLPTSILPVPNVRLCISLKLVHAVGL
jgi:hypothetical protein